MTFTLILQVWLGFDLYSFQKLIKIDSILNSRGRFLVEFGQNYKANDKIEAWNSK